MHSDFNKMKQLEQYDTTNGKIHYRYCSGFFLELFNQLHVSVGENKPSKRERGDLVIREHQPEVDKCSAEVTYVREI